MKKLKEMLQKKAHYDRGFCLIIICCFYLISCRQNSIESYLEQRLGEKQQLYSQSRNSDKEINADTLNAVVSIIYKEIREDSVLYKGLSKLSFTNDSTLHIYYLKVAFLKHKPNSKLNVELIRNTYFNYTDSIWDKEIKRDSLINDSIASVNLEMIDIGDSISVVLPLRRSLNGDYSIFYTSGYPYSLDYNSADDSVKLNLIVYRTENNRTVVSKVLKLSKDEVYYGTQLLHPGIEFRLELTNYGRIINATSQ